MKIKAISCIAMLITFLILAPLVSAAHYVIGYVEDALDGTSANDHTVVLWNPSRGDIDDNLTDIIGPNGNSGTDNTYMIDCEMLDNGCQIGDELNVKIINNGDNYISEIKNVTVTGAGYDVVGNISLNSPPFIEDIFVDDSLKIPADEIDLLPATTKKIICTANITDYDGQGDLKNASAVFFDINYNYNADDDDNYHYTNNSCYLNNSFGTSNQAQAICKFDIKYYSNPGTWRCRFSIQDNLSNPVNSSDSIDVNTLLALGVDSPIDFGEINSGNISDELILNVTNYGNVQVNLSLSGYAFSEGDGFAMNCSLGDINISIEYEKFNLTSPNPGVNDLAGFNNVYENLSSDVKIKKFNLDYRKSDTENDAINQTYWRIYVPESIGGSCQGNIVFGAVQSPGN
jgi:hypothetical protein